ncbi:uncharacterized protein LOC123307676 [Coccinella septempunctata]|uniref:uncharacterized protein LOC123307676 n=1 Tax=Coccinella septempunctata TaxID=41139 RepID=UPI001D091A3C|nr:uncharacterized protein LOC123307676 [Coccinella septempunctata]
MQSAYLIKLLQENPDLGQRYTLKLAMINNVDPFTFKTSEMDYSVDGIPPVSFPDIFSYIVLTHSFYTNEQMKAYKTLDAHKYFSAGFVMKVGTRIMNNFYFMVGKVKHSQRANAKPLEAWCIITKDGSISKGHCTCMAGNSEVCSHIGALLFAAEYAFRNKSTVSCTDVAALWPMPSLATVVPIIPISEMDFGAMAGPIPRDISVPPMETEDITNLLKRIEDIGQTASVMRIVEPFASKLNKAVEVTLPNLFNIFDETYISKQYTELMEISKAISLSLTAEEVLLIEQHTVTYMGCVIIKNKNVLFYVDLIRSCVMG